MNKLSISFFGFLILLLLSKPAFSQGPCTTGAGNTKDFFTWCQSGSSYTLTGDYTITVSNNSTLNFNGNVTINGTLTINLVGSTSTVIVKNGFELQATNITFSGSATGKLLQIEGPDGSVNVPGTLDFGGLTIDLDGSGSLSAGNIDGADNITCNSDGNCPTVDYGTCNDGGSGVCTDGELPIELLFFKSNITNSGVELTWATAKEDNFNYFSVERSRNGKDYEEIAQIKGAGFSRSIINYGFTDTNPLNGKSYYRLNAIDLDLFQEYSQPIMVNTGTVNSNNISVSPNPLEGTQLSLISENMEEEAKVLIYDMSGVLIRELPYVSGVAMDLGSRLKPGIYMVLLNGALSQSKTKLIVR